ncbi:PT repeat/fibro-slime domain containing protein [Nitzschia inconspicua]|uniref:PT repeat/fibro-slime domain containing protein n=1 Tax=Nitzschia inconspicua TaxID=303405 RepID=A0A9K3M447_9STRA|nr:PT repeat/fibro-slime domain containing protein [Nitzschia inconspicua]
MATGARGRSDREKRNLNTADADDDYFYVPPTETTYNSIPVHYPPPVPTYQTPTYQPSAQYESPLLYQLPTPSVPHPAPYHFIPIPTPLPTQDPTPLPTTDAPSLYPSSSPTTLTPSAAPSGAPSRVPSATPSGFPSANPSVEPSEIPSVEPSASPSLIASTQPSTEPTNEASDSPSSGPSMEPSMEPSVEPSIASTTSEEPSENPTVSEEPSVSPTISLGPSVSPSQSFVPTLSLVPSVAPSKSIQPSSGPTISPQPTNSIQPSISPTRSQGPSVSPSNSSQPSSSEIPSYQPSTWSEPSLSPGVPVDSVPFRIDYQPAVIVFEMSTLPELEQVTSRYLDFYFGLAFAGPDMSKVNYVTTTARQTGFSTYQRQNFTRISFSVTLHFEPTVEQPLLPNQRMVSEMIQDAFTSSTSSSSTNDPDWVAVYIDRLGRRLPADNGFRDTTAVGYVAASRMS